MHAVGEGEEAGVGVALGQVGAMTSCSEKSCPFINSSPRVCTKELFFHFIDAGYGTGVAFGVFRLQWVGVTCAIDPLILCDLDITCYVET